MDYRIAGTYLLFLLAIIIGLYSCWVRVGLQLTSKIVWTIIIIVFPIAGTIAFYLWNDPSGSTDSLKKV